MHGSPEKGCRKEGEAAAGGLLQSWVRLGVRVGIRGEEEK